MQPSGPDELPATRNTFRANGRPGVPDHRPRTDGDAGPRADGGRGPQAGQTATPLPPLEVPGYEVLGELGRGGMGVVYQARQVGLNRIVALKMILHAQHAGTDERERFRLEAEAVARLQHPNIVQVYEIGEHDGLPFFSLEF